MKAKMESALIMGDNKLGILRDYIKDTNSID